MAQLNSKLHQMPAQGQKDGHQHSNQAITIGTDVQGANHKQRQSAQNTGYKVTSTQETIAVVCEVPESRMHIGDGLTWLGSEGDGSEFIFTLLMIC